MAAWKIQETTMKFVTGIIATTALSFLLTPALRADDDKVKPAAKPAADTAVISNVAPGTVTQPGTVTRPTEIPVPARSSPWGASESETPKVEIFLGYSFIRALPTSTGNRIAWLHGGSTSLAYNFNRHLGLVLDLGGSHADRFGPLAPPDGGVVDASGNVFTYLFGPRLSFRHERFTPFAQVLFGGVYATDVTIARCAGLGCTVLPSENAFALTAGGGLDITLHRHVALRLFQAEYLMTRFADRSTASGNTATQNDVRLSTGLVFRFGGNPPPPPPNRPPVVACFVDKNVIYAGSGDTVVVRAEASDPDNDPLTYSWMPSEGSVDGSGAVVRWNSSGMALGHHTFRVRVEDGRGGRAECSAAIQIDPQPNRAPTISCSADRSPIFQGDGTGITSIASDPDNDPLTYSYTSAAGRIVGTGPNVRFESKGLPAGSYSVKCGVNDGRGGVAEAMANVDVQRSAEEVKLESRLALHSIYFATARPTEKNPGGGLAESQQAVLVSLAADFKSYLGFRPDAHLILGGHADPRGTPAYNKALTERRVERAKSFLVEHGVPADSIEVQAFGEEQEMSAEQVKQLMQDDPDLSAEERRKLMSNLHVIVLANNRRVDITLSTTGQQSVRRYPFNAHDAMSLISPAGGDKAAAREKSPK
jgi:outer membrane protein OmpA-like peptidoglycan-associated protein/opacity protein-like surface antigen